MNTEHFEKLETKSSLKNVVRYVELWQLTYVMYNYGLSIFWKRTPCIFPV